MDTKIRSLERQIETIKRELVKVGELRPGTLSEQYNVCGTPGCRCKASTPEKHGPYYQLSYTRNGKSRTRFVRRENLPEVKKLMRHYARFRSLVDRWIDLAIDLSDLRIAATKSRASERR